MFQPITPGTKIETTGSLYDIADKGKGALVTF
jgi:hypothetical protein